MLNEIKINDKKYIIKKIEPLNFVDTKIGVPLNLFLEHKEKTMFDQVKENCGSIDKDKNNDIEQQDKNIIKLLSECVIKENNKTINDHQAFYKSIKNTNILNSLINELIRISLTKLNKIYSIDREYALILDNMAQRYSKTPAQLVMHNEGTTLDHYLFNRNIYLIARTNEYKELKNMKLNSRNSIRRR